MKRYDFTVPENRRREQGVSLRLPVLPRFRLMRCAALFKNEM